MSSEDIMAHAEAKYKPLLIPPALGFRLKPARLTTIGLCSNLHAAVFSFKEDPSLSTSIKEECLPRVAGILLV